MINIYPNSTFYRPTGATNFYALQDTDSQSKLQKIYVELEKIKQQFKPTDHTYCCKGDTQPLIELYDEAIAGDRSKLFIVAMQMYNHAKPSEKNWFAKIILHAVGWDDNEMVHPLPLFYLAKILIDECDGEAAIAQLEYLEAHEFAPAIALMGRLYHQGELVEKNDEVAVRMWQSAAEKGHIYGYLWEASLLAKQKPVLEKLKGSAWLCLRFLKVLPRILKMDDAEREIAILL